MSNQQDALKTGRADSLGRRPAIANAAAPVGQARREYEGRRALGNGSRIKLERIQSDPDQPRKTFGTEADDRLIKSMTQRGQLVPILVRWNAEVDRYIVIDGDRRFRAAGKAGLSEMACVVEDESRPDEILELQLITNALREDVQPVEQARAWDRLRTSQGLTHRELAAKLGYDHTMVNKALALLSLTPGIQDQVDAGQIAASTGSLIAKLPDAGGQEALAARVVVEGLSRAEVAEVVSEYTTSRAARDNSGKAGSKGKAKAKVVTTRKFKAGGGLVITAERAKGLDLLGLVEALRLTADQIEAEVSASTDLS